MIEYHTVLTALHLFGVVVGLGAAFVSDAIFFSSIRDEKVSHTELRFLRLGGRIVSLGLLLIVISGLLLFMQSPAEYLASAKFLAKMTIVAILIANGAVFHLVHIPRFSRHASHHFPSSDEFMRAVPLLLASGVISTVSWLSAFVLGLWRGVPYSYLEIMSVYGAVLFVSSVSVIVLKRRFIPHFRER